VHIEGVTYLPCRTYGNLYLDIVLSLLHNLTVLMRHADCDIYYCLKPAPNNGIPALLARLLGKRIILDIDDLDHGYFPPGIRLRISRFFFDRLPRWFELVTCHTPRLLEYVEHQLGIAANRRYFLPQGVSDVFLEHEGQPAESAAPRSLAYAASLGITSDFDALLPMLSRLASRYPDLHIDIIGDGVRREDFERMAYDLGLEKQARFLGRVPHEDLPAVLARSRIGINYMKPSVTNECRAILKIREYLALGMTVVCNDVGDARSFAPYVHVEDSLEGMEKALERFLSKPPQTIAHGRLHVETNYRWGQIVSDFLHRLESVAAA